MDADVTHYLLVIQGLSRRFSIEDAFKFEDFSSEELLEILNMKLKQQNLDATPEAKSVALEVLERSSVYFSELR